MPSATYRRLLQSRSFRRDGNRQNIPLFAGLFLSVSLVCMSPMPLWCQGGQVINATLTGTVLDPSESSIAGAKVTLISPSTGLVREFTTSTNGSYTFTLIPPGVYQLKVEMAGFAPFQQDKIELTLGQASRLDVKLQVKSASQRVEVTGAPPLLDTENVNLGSVVSTKQIVEMPLNFRSTFWLVNLDSNVNRNQVDQSTSSPGTQGVGNGAANDQDSAEFNFSGTFFGTQALLLDGHWDGGPQWDGLQYAPTVEETDEFMVQTNTFSPQYGWSMGNVLNAITKSGTRDLHGGAFDFLRNSIMDANNFFSNAERLPRPAFRRNQFGAYLGGPIYIPKLYRQRDKTFFFFNWESTRETSPSNFVATVPTAQQLRGDFSQTFNANGSPNVIYDPGTTQIVNGQYVRTPFSGNQIPASRTDPVAAKMAAYWPAPNRAGAAFTGQNNFVGAAGLPFNSDAFTGRLDQNITDNQRIFFRYSHKMEISQRMGDFFGANDPGGPGVSAPNPRWDAGLQYTYAINPTLVLNATLGMNRWNEQQYEQNYPFDPSGLGLPATLNAVTGGGSFPNVSVSGVYGLGGGGSSVNLISETRTGDISLTKVNGAHTLTAGFTTIIFHGNRQTATQASLSFGQQFTQGPNPVTGDPSTGAGLASFLLGLGSGSITNQVEPAFGKYWAGWYFNDEWKVSRNLTLNLGLRYDFQAAPTERFNRGSYLTYAPNPLGAQVGLPLNGGLQFTGNGNPRAMYDPQYTNVAPRLGLSWSPTQRLVVRSAFGTFYIPATGLSPGLPGYTQSTPWIGYQGSTSGLIPGPPLSTAFSTGLIPPPGSSLGELTQVGQGIVDMREPCLRPMWSSGHSVSSISFQPILL